MDKKKLFKLASLLVKFAEVATDKGTLVCDGDLEIGIEVMLPNEEGEMIAPEDGEYRTDKDIIVVEGGLVKDIKPIEEEPKEEELEEETIEEPKEEEPDERDAKIAELEAMIEERDAKIAELEAQIEELKNKPVEEPIEQKLSAQVKNDANGALKYFQ